MNLAILNLQAIGISQILLALIHLGFEKRFNWKQEFTSLSLLNRQMTYVHTFFIAFTVFLNGLLCFFAAEHLVTPSPLGFYLLFGLSIFWITRLYTQFFVYKTELWRGKTFETTVHIVFSLIWLWYSLSFLFLAWKARLGIQL